MVLYIVNFLVLDSICTLLKLNFQEVLSISFYKTESIPPVQNCSLKSLLYVLNGFLRYFLHLKTFQNTCLIENFGPWFSSLIHKEFSQQMHFNFSKISEILSRIWIQKDFQSKISKSLLTNNLLKRFILITWICI